MPEIKKVKKVVVKKKKEVAAPEAEAKPGLKVSKKKKEKPAEEPAAEPEVVEAAPEPVIEPEPVPEVPQPVPEEEVVVDAAAPVDPATRENTGNWDVEVGPQAVYEVHEGETSTVEVKLFKGDVLSPPKVTWIKGKWNQMTKGDRWAMVSSEDHMTHSLTFQKPKMNESGLYQVKIVSKAGKTEQLSYQLKVLPAKQEAGLELGKGVSPGQKDTEADCDFRNKLRKIRSKAKPTEDSDIWTTLRDAKTNEYEQIGFEHSVNDVRPMQRRLAQINKAAGKKHKCFGAVLPQHKHYKQGEKMMIECETKDKLTEVKWFQDGKKCVESDTVHMVSNGFKRQLIVDSAQLNHDGTYTATIGEDVTSCEVFVEQPKCGIAKSFEDTLANNGDEVVLECGFTTEGGKYRVFKNGEPLEASSTVKLVRDGTSFKIIINPCDKKHSGYYSVETNNGDMTVCDCVIEEKSAEITKAFSDLKVNFKDRAEFICEVSDANVKGKWTKDGKELDDKADKRIKAIAIGKMRKLVIAGVENGDQGEYGFEVDGQPSLKLSACLEATGGFATVSKKKEAPKIYLDRSEDKSITVKAGNNLKLDIPIQGDQVTAVWRNAPAGDESGELISEEGKRIWCSKSNEKERTTFNLTKAEFDDQGPYSCYIEKTDQDENVHKSWHEFMVMVIDKPSPPQKPTVSDIGSDECMINWCPPLDDGGCEFRGYIIERKKASSSRWIRLNGAHCNFHSFHAKRMVEGQKYQVRITAVNEVGSSEPSELSDEFIPLAPTAGVSRFTVGKKTDDSIELKWLEPEEVGAGGLDSYTIEMKLMDADGNGEWEAAKSNFAKLNLTKDMTSVDLKKLQTARAYFFRIRTNNAAGSSEWKEIGPTICAETVEEAKINVPRPYANGKQIKFVIGSAIKLIIPFQGKPRPVVEWTKNNEELPIADNGRPKFNIRTVDGSTTLYGRTSDLWDCGTYNLSVRVGTQVAKADFEIVVIDVASKPMGVNVVDVVGNSAQLKWKKPKFDGNSEIVGYQVEKRTAKHDDWYVCVDKVRHPQVQINDLVLGNSFYFRVKAINEVGLGEEGVTKEAATIVKEKSTYRKAQHGDMDFSMKPEFTIKLNDRKIMEGYNGVLTASLKGFPKPKLRWYIGKREIIDNPKYKTTMAQGIVQLELRRARPGDGGVYRLVAENKEGSVECEATVTVKSLKD